MRDPDLSPELELRNARDRLKILDGLVRALEDPHAVLDVLIEAEDVTAARRELQAQFGLDEIQASAVLDLQFRRTPRLERQKVIAHRAEMLAVIEHLEQPE